MTVSVIIPCFNAEAYLAQTIGSVLEQTIPPKEIIVVDDGSTDDSLDVARRFGGDVRILSKENEGASSARNDGYALASGDALMFLDADDILGPIALEALASALSRNPGSIAICPWYRLEKEGKRWVRRPPSYRPRRPEQDDLSAWLERWYHPPCSVMWSRTAYERTGGWDERVTVNDDGDIMMRALVAGIPLVRADGGASFYRRIPMEDGSLSSGRYSKRGIESEMYVYSKIAFMLEKEDRLADYREEIGQAFDDLAGMCEHRFPELFVQCKKYAARYDSPRIVRALRRRARRAGSKMTAALSSDEQPQPQNSSEGIADVEVHFGMETAASRVADGVSNTDAASPSLLRLDPPQVSVVIPTYNRSDVLPRALKSVFNQTFDDFQVIVVDDGSTDETEELMASYSDDRLRYVRQSDNHGVAAARNRGMRMARGDYIAFLDSDDEWTEGKLERQMTRFTDLSEDVGLLYSGAVIIEDDGATATFRPKHRGHTFEDLLVQNVIHASSGVMIRRNVIRAAGFFDEDIPAIEDYDYWLRVARFYRFDFVEEPLFRYFHHGDVVRKTAEIEKNLAAYDYFFHKHCHDMQQAGVTHLFLKESAHRHLVAGRSDKKGVRPLAWRAVRWQPFAYEAHRFLLSVTLPDRHFQKLRDMYQSARSLITGNT